MSEYQCYEFLALDQPLTAKQMAELRAISSRAKISPTRFWNEYEWGDLKADPAKLMQRYFDAHLYFANWGTHRLMLRMPHARVDHVALAPYFNEGESASLKRAGDHVVLELLSEDDDREDDELGGASLRTLAALRVELMQGDLRAAYLAWLLAVDVGDLSEDAEEPPVAAGLANLTTAQEAMVEFLRIDADLLAAAASGSATAGEDAAPFRKWVETLSKKEKDGWLLRAADQPELALGGELLRAYRATAQPPQAQSGARRTVGELLALADELGAERERAEEARDAKAKAKADAARQRHLTKLAADADAAWVRLEELVEASRYDDAITLAVDLRDVAAQDQTSASFEARLKDLRKRHARRRGFFDRWKHLALPSGAR